MKTPKEIAQHYIRYYCPEYNELTCCEIYQLKYRENDSDFLNKVSEILKPKFFSSISIEDIYESLFFIDIAEFFDHNQELLKYDFIDKHSFGKNQQVYSKNKMKMSLGHYNITPFNPIYNVYIDFILDKDKLVSNENTLTLLCNDDILIYNKYNLEKSLLIYIEAIKKRYLRSSIIFSYLTSFLRSTTDLTDFFYISSGCEKGNYTTTIREIESHCPIGEDGFFDKQNFITIKKEQSFICIYNQFDQLLLKKDSRLISKNNFNIEFIIPLKKIISDLDNLRASNFFTIRKENLEKNILNSIKKDYSHQETIFSFFYSYIKEHTDLNHFFNLEPLTSQNSKMKITEYSMFYLTNNICKHIYIENKQDIFFILDHNANILYQKDLKLITKSNFSTDILEPLKDILNNMNKYRKKNFIKSWGNDVFQYMSTVIDKQDMTALKAKIYRPKLKSEFLNNIIYYQKPVIEIFFILNNKEVSSLKMDENYDYHIKDIKATYQIYKDLLNINAENLELKNLIAITKIENKKKRI